MHGGKENGGEVKADDCITVDMVAAGRVAMDAQYTDADDRQERKKLLHNGLRQTQRLIALHSATCRSQFSATLGARSVYGVEVRAL